MVGLGLGRQAPQQAGGDFRRPPAHADDRLLGVPLDQPVVLCPGKRDDDAAVAPNDDARVVVADTEVGGEAMEADDSIAGLESGEAQSTCHEDASRPDEWSPDQLGVGAGEKDPVRGSSLDADEVLSRGDGCACP